MNRRLALIASTALVVLSVGLSFAGLYVVDIVRGSLDGADATGSAVLAISFAIVGGIIVARRGHLVGWIMLLSGFFNSLNTISTDYSILALRDDLPLRMLAAWISPWVWALGAAGFPLVLLFFPSGRPPSRRWWPVAAATICGALLIVVAGAIESFPLASRPLTGEQIFALTGDGIWGTFEDIGLPLLGLSFVLSAVSLGFRYRRARNVERQEIKWLLLGGAITIVVIFTASPAAPWNLERSIPWLSDVALVALAAIPAGVGIAITRYHLYDIDVVINRTLVYLALTAILAFTYLGAVVLLQRAVGGFTQESDLAVAGSTLAVAALFRPLRARVQGFIDRRFYRRKYNVSETLDRFSARLRDQVDLDSLKNELTHVVGTTIQPAHASLWLREVHR